MSVEKARFRNPVIPDCQLQLNIEAIRSHGRVWKYKGTAKVEGKRILNDLERRCHDFSTSYVKGDSHQSAFLEGQRSVLIYIKNKLRKLGV